MKGFYKLLSLSILNLSKVEKEGKVGEDLLEEGDPIRPDLGFIGEDFDLIKECS